MRPTRSYSAQHVAQSVMHRGLLFRVEGVHGTHQNFERIACNRFLALTRQSQTYASPVRPGSLSDQVSTCLKRLNGLRCGATGRRLKFRKCRRGAGERVSAGEEAERHPLGGAEFAVIALGLHEPPDQQQEFRRFARRHDGLFEIIIVFRNYLDNRPLGYSFVSKLVRVLAWPAPRRWRSLRPNPASPITLSKSGGFRCWSARKNTCSPSVGASMATVTPRASSSLAICGSCLISLPAIPAPTSPSP